MEKEENNSKKYIRNMFLFLLLIFITFYVVFKDQSVNEILKIIDGVDKRFIAIGVVAMLMYFTCETINLTRTLKALGEKSSFIKNFKYTLIGFFFSSITPAASGGQPMEIYYMSKEGIKVANSTIALLANLATMQIATISIALISLIFNYQYMNGLLIFFFIIGILLNASALTLLLISIYSKRATNAIVNFCVKFMHKFHFKNIEQKEEKLRKELEIYQSNSDYVKTHKKLVFKNVITTYIQFLIYYSISYWVYRSFGYSDTNIFTIISMQSVLFATVSGIPSPGAVGVSEGAFIEIYRNIYTKKQIKSSMLLCRGINFYLFVIISMFIVLYASLRNKKKESTTSGKV